MDYAAALLAPLALLIVLAAGWVMTLLSLPGNWLMVLAPRLLRADWCPTHGVSMSAGSRWVWSWRSPSWAKCSRRWPSRWAHRARWQQAIRLAGFVRVDRRRPGGRTGWPADPGGRIGGRRSVVRRRWRHASAPMSARPGRGERPTRAGRSARPPSGADCSARWPRSWPPP